MKISKNVTQAIKVLKKGGVIVYPTDTAYGLGADAFNLNAVRKVYRLKKRNFKKPLPLIAGMLGQIEKIVYINNKERELIKKYWPGPLTILLKLKSQNSGLKTLSRKNKIGLRIPRNKTARLLAKKLGRPMIATSANLAGQKECYQISEVIQQFRNKKIKPDLILDGGKLEKVKPSTVVEIEGKKLRLLRKGPVEM